MVGAVVALAQTLGRGGCGRRTRRRCLWPSDAGRPTLGRARLGFADDAEIDEFVRTLERYERGELTPDQWRAFRLVRGTYGQRQAEDAQMLRVKIPQGILDGPQLHALADVAETYSRGFGHVTTRQNVQFHFLKLHDVETAMRRLAESGLTTREACGSAVRNVTACPDAGVAADELFDVTPYAEALTRYFLRHPLAAALPRKFKIAFEGCPTDHALTAINDLGWRARMRRRGPARLPRHGGRGHVHPAALGRAAVRLPARGRDPRSGRSGPARLPRPGDFKHKQRNRMKFLIRDLGFAVWRAGLRRGARGRAAKRAGSRCPSIPTIRPSRTHRRDARPLPRRDRSPRARPPPGSRAPGCARRCCPSPGAVTSGGCARTCARRSRTASRWPR